jgi:hypothetical protein
MLIKTIAHNHWRMEGDHRFATWYEPLDDQPTIDAAVAFALERREVTGICTAGDIDLVPLMVEAERTRGSASMDAIEAELARVPEYEPPFVRVEGRAAPDWIDAILPK